MMSQNLDEYRHKTILIFVDCALEGFEVEELKGIEIICREMMKIRNNNWLLLALIDFGCFNLIKALSMPLVSNNRPVWLHEFTFTTAIVEFVRSSPQIEILFFPNFWN
jgi:hypothetical protein